MDYQFAGSLWLRLGVDLYDLDLVSFLKKRVSSKLQGYGAVE